MIRLQIPHRFLTPHELRSSSAQFSETDTYVSFGNLDTDVEIIRHLQVRFFYWQVHPDYFSLIFRIRTRLIPARFHSDNPFTRYCRNRLVRQLLDHSAMVVMSESHLKFSRATERPLLRNKILPIPITGVPANPPLRNMKRLENGRISIIYIGRPQDWKITPFLVVLKDLNRAVRDGHVRMEVTVVTTDDLPFRKRLADSGFENKLPLQFRLGLSDNALSLFLEQEADLVFSMGTSLLEAAKLGIPTAFADACLAGYSPEDYKYRWLFETTGYNLGNPLRNQADQLPGRTMEEVIRAAEDTRKSEEIGKACHRYTASGHSVGNISEAFLAFTEQSQLFTRNLRWIIPFFTLKEKSRRLFRLF